MITIFPINCEKLGLSMQGKPILRDITLTLHSSAIYALVGANGSGKTSFLKVLHGLIAATRGQMTFAGNPSSFNPQSAFAQQAFVPQKTQWLRLNVFEQMRMVLGGLNKTQQTQLIEKTLTHVGLMRYCYQPVTNLSAGEQQRLALARAWMLAPQLLLLDEPTANLDPSACLQVEQLLTEINQTGCTILLVTHHLAQAKRLAQQILFAHEGVVHASQSTVEFFTEPRSHHAKQYLAGEMVWTDMLRT